jgi:hypothetical protein
VQPCIATDFVTFAGKDFERSATCVDVRNREIDDDQLAEVQSMPLLSVTMLFSQRLPFAPGADSDTAASTAVLLLQHAQPAA